MTLPTVPRDLWTQDGSLRDVLIREATLPDWAALLDLARRHAFDYQVDGVAMALPSAERIFASRDVSHLLRIRIGQADLNCLFYLHDEIELDIDPRQVVELETHQALLGFLADLATATGKTVDITEENAPEFVLLRFDPTSARWHSP
ncbi:hypothetical protein ACQ86G_13725 [Roseateles chitinivorans]|uniref:hypothetical protein n=1 Tax=Roseateles chitinivorans TaxID=2917965 RepID=UPI003D6749F8